LTGHLSLVHIARYSVTDIPRTVPPQVLANVNDINNNVGTWGAQPDFFFTERLIPSVATFTDAELEDIYEDQVRTWSQYQTAVGLRAIKQSPDADLVMIYSEQPDGSEHQFLLTDPRQATNPTDPTTILGNQDQAKIARYAKYVQVAYQAGDNLVQRVIDQVGVDSEGRPKSNIFVVSDHGFDIFHTTVLLNNLLAAAGIDLTQARAVTSGPAANIYINLKGRQPTGAVTPSDYVALQQKIVSVLQRLALGRLIASPVFSTCRWR
jgi:Type I phosphodiesterase / nucleotide pyrophosphatase